MLAQFLHHHASPGMPILRAPPSRARQVVGVPDIALLRDLLARDRSFRSSLADAIETLIALLDEHDGDGDLEPSLGWGGDPRGCDARTTRGVPDDREEDVGDDRETEDEHGGDVCDEPHDAEGESDLYDVEDFEAAFAGPAEGGRPQRPAVAL